MPKAREGEHEEGRPDDVRGDRLVPPAFFIGASGTTVDFDVTAPSNEPDVPPERGSRLGPFRLIELLGTGGTGSVWLAEAVEATEPAPEGARIALKLLHARLLADADARSRFLREARVGASVRHPAIVRTLGAGVAGERPWLAMELVEGRTFRDVVRELGRVPEPLLRAIARQVAEALEAIHSTGIVHRDLKPGNLIITPSQQIRVMDLGTAVDLADEARLTRAGLFVGTLLYASPEQFGLGEVGPASDLYSLGVLLYEAATGTNPFDAPDVRGVLRKHIDHVPLRAGQIETLVTPFFEELLASLLEKDPKLRPASAGVLAALLAEGEASEWWQAKERELRTLSPRGEIRRAKAAPDAPLVGREREVAAIRAIAGEAFTGKGRVIVLEGEAGIGKSRVMDAVETVIAEDWPDALVLTGASPPGDVGLGHGAIAAALVGHFGVAGLRREIEASSSGNPRLAAAFMAHLASDPLAPGEPPLGTEGLAAIACRLARSLASKRPVAWIVEDYHFASAETRALVVALARQAPTLPFVLIVTCRAAPGGPADALARLPGATRMTLGRLSPAEVVRLVTHALHSESAADRLGGKVARKSDGNPFFIVEMLREMKERGALRQVDDGSWRTTGEISALDVPSSVRDFLHGRLRDLGDDDRALLDVGSVLGFHFDPDLVARVLDRKRLEVLQSLAGISRRTGVVRATGTGFQFDHHQLQEVILDALPAPLRTEYHALVADAWTERAGLTGKSPEDVPPEAACLLAEHLLRGGRPLEGAVHAPNAMRHLFARSETEAASALGDLALPALAGLPDALRCDIATIHAQCLGVLGRRPRERAAAEDAVAAAQRAGDVKRESLALTALGSHHNSASEYPEGRAVLERAITLAVASGDRGTHVKALGAMAGVLFRLGDYPLARDIGETLVAEARAIGDDVALASGLGQLGAVLSRLGDDDAAFTLFEQSRDLARQLGRRRVEAMGLSRMGMIHNARGDYEAARAAIEGSGAISRELGYTFGVADESLGLSYVTFNQGRYAEARQHAKDAEELFAEVGNTLGRAVALDSAASASLLLGNVEAAREDLDRCFELGREVGSRLVDGFATLWLADIEAVEGREDAALEHDLRAVELGEELGDEALLATARLACARRLIERGDDERAREVLHAALAARTGPSHSVPEWLLRACLVAAGEGSAGDVKVPERGALEHRVVAELCLHRATRDAARLHAARDMLTRSFVDLDDEGWAAFWARSPLGRFFRSSA